MSAEVDNERIERIKLDDEKVKLYVDGNYVDDEQKREVVIPKGSTVHARYDLVGIEFLSNGTMEFKKQIIVNVKTPQNLIEGVVTK